MKKVALFLSAIVWVACENVSDDFLVPDPAVEAAAEHFVPLDYAESIASVFNGYVPHGEELVTRAVEVREVKDAVTYTASDGSSAYHIINLQGGGFRVISADNRLQPVFNILIIKV